MPGWPPGLIDLQLNGFRGHDINANDLTAETVRRLAFSMLATGVRSKLELRTDRQIEQGRFSHEITLVP
jgi:N-acetylglucosamine-6-phosphate deacetylase